MELRSPGLGRLPLMYLTDVGTRFDESIAEAGGITLGPYPVDEVTITETRRRKPPATRTIVR